MPTVKGHMLHPTKGVRSTKKQAFRQHVVDNQKSSASILRQNLAPPQSQDKAFTFSADQLVKFVANVVIQVAQPQVCYVNPTQDAIDKKSSLCRRVSEAAKTHLGPVHMNPGQLIAPGQLTDPGVNFASVHGLKPVTVHMRSSLPRGNFERRVTLCTTPGNPPCHGNFSPCEQNTKVAPGQE